MEIQPKGWRLSSRTWLGLLGLGIVLWLLISQAELILEVIWILFGALLIALAVRPLADFLTRWRIPRGVTALGVYLGVGGLLFALGVLLKPAVNSEIGYFQANGAALIQKAIAQLHSLTLIGNWLSANTNLAQNLAQRLDSLINPLVAGLASVGGAALDVILALVIAYFLIVDSKLNLPRLLDGWLPEAYRSRTLVFLEHLSLRLTRWVWAQVAIALFFAVVFSAGLALIRVPFALTIGLTGGILEVIPYLGGAVALLLALFSALATNPTLVLWVLVLYVVEVEVESHLIAPVFYGRVIGLHLVVILLALVVGFKLGGIIGVLLAVPVAVVVVSFAREFQIRSG